MNAGYLVGLLWLLAVLPAWAGALPVDSSPGRCRLLYLDKLELLDRQWQVDEFHIHYASRGSQALADLSDSDGNGVPDMIDDLALQLVTARRLFNDVLGLRPPLQQPRYALAKHIHVFVVELGGGNGLAFDEVASERDRPGGPGLPCAIKMFIDRKIRPADNITPAHELFHLYQYSYTQFKSRWFLEGMARWVESAFVGPHRLRADARGRTRIDCRDVFAQSYAASAYWWLQAAASAAADVPITDELRALHYRQGKAVIRVASFPNGRFLKPALEALQLASAEVARERNLALYNWQEQTQRSAQFDPRICQAVESIRF